MGGISSRRVTEIKRVGVDICECSKSDEAWIICEQPERRAEPTVFGVSLGSLPRNVSGDEKCSLTFCEDARALKRF
jgi:hypothetical protein